MVCYKWELDGRKQRILHCLLEDRVVNKKIYTDDSSTQSAKYLIYYRLFLHRFYNDTECIPESSS